MAAPQDYYDDLALNTLQDLCKGKNVTNWELQRNDAAALTQALRANDNPIEYTKLRVPALKEVLNNRGEALPEVRRKSRFVSALQDLDARLAVPPAAPSADGAEGAGNDPSRPETPGTKDNDLAAPVQNPNTAGPDSLLSEQSESAILRFAKRGCIELRYKEPRPVDNCTRLKEILKSLSMVDQDRLNKAANGFFRARREANEAKAVAADLEARYVTLGEYRDSQLDESKGPVGERPTFDTYLRAEQDVHDRRQARFKAADDLRSAIAGIDWTGCDVVPDFVRYLEKQKTSKRAAEWEAKLNGLYDMLEEYKAILDERKQLLASTTAENLGSDWHGSWLIGEGGFGTASLWLECDSSGKVMDRMLVKDSHSPAWATSAWSNQDLWSPMPSNPEIQVPNEILAMYELRSRQGAENIVRIRNWRIRTQEKMHRIFMEFLPYGDLWDLAHLYVPDRKKQDNGDGKISNANTYIPEAMLWHLFETMAIAGLLMQHGEMEENPLSDWNPIIHRDLKLENVFMTYPHEERYREYPSAKVADFGLAIFVRPDNPREPSDISVSGTSGKMAPEQTHHILAGEVELRPLSELTNVWGVGNTMWTLVMLNRDARLTLNNFENENLRTLTFYDDGRHLKPKGPYSRALINLISDCASYNPDDRPTFKKVLEVIRQCTGTGKSDYADGLRNMAADEARWSQPEHALLPDWVKNKYQDLYAIGTRVDTLTKVGDFHDMPKPSPDAGTDGRDDQPGGVPGTELEPSFKPANDTADVESESAAATEPRAAGRRTSKGRISSHAHPGAEAQRSSSKRKQPPDVAAPPFQRPAKRLSSK